LFKGVRFTARAILIDDRDNAAVLIDPASKGGDVTYSTKDGSSSRLTAREDVPIYHKIAVAYIKEGSPIVKYGQHIGVATGDITEGMHIHVHNVKSVREKL
jgi:altronate dehydratase small subunit